MSSGTTFEQTLDRYELLQRLADPDEAIDPIFDNNGESTTLLTDFSDWPPNVRIPLASLDQLTPEFVQESLVISRIYRVQEGIVTRNSRANGMLTVIRKEAE